MIDFGKKTIISVLLFGGTVIIVIAAIIWPTVTYIKNLSQETLELKTYMEKRYESVQHTKYAKQKIQEIKNEVMESSGLLYESNKQLQLITALENVATRNNMTQKIEGLNPDETTHQLMISLNASGSYLDSLRYLSDIEKINYFLQINKLTFSALLDRGEVSSSTKMSLELELYVND